MFRKILLQMQEKIRHHEYVMTAHARKETNEDELTIYDVEQGILSGEILEWQRDRETDEWKYRVNGETMSGEKNRNRDKIKYNWQTCDYYRISCMKGEKQYAM